MIKKVLAVLCLFVVACGIGCAALSSYLTPADIDRNAVNYVVQSGVAEVNDYDGYGNLYLAEQLKQDVDKAYKINQFELQKAAEKNDLDYSILSDVTNQKYLAAVAREKALFGETGLLSTGLTALGFGAFTGLLGLMRKRPGDITPEESSAAIAQATGQSQEEIQAKIVQLKQVVAGVEQFKTELKDKISSDSNAYVKVADLLVDMKNTFNANEDTETQQAVAVAKISEV